MVGSIFQKNILKDTQNWKEQSHEAAERHLKARRTLYDFATIHRS